MTATLYRIDGPWPGRLAILPRPRPGDWLRDEVAEWKKGGIDVVVSALTADEIAELGLDQEQAECQASDIEYVAFPIADRGIPASLKATEELVRGLEVKLVAGKGIGIHCRAGIGRSSLLAACLLVFTGLTPESAFALIESARGMPVPDTPEQQEWVARFQRGLQTSST